MELVGALIAAHLVPWGSGPGETPVPSIQASQAGSTSQFSLLVAFFNENTSTKQLLGLYEQVQVVINAH